MFKMMPKNNMLVKIEALSSNYPWQFETIQVNETDPNEKSRRCKRERAFEFRATLHGPTV
jgi:hypothetical protein